MERCHYDSVETKMNMRTATTKALQGLAGLTLAFASTYVLVRLDASSTVAGMAFLVLVVWSATQVGPWLSAMLAILFTVLFDYYFLLPFRSFRLLGASEWVALCCYLASCLVVSRVAELARRQTRQAEQRREDVERLYELSQQMTLYEDPTGLIYELPQLLHRLFALDDVVLYMREQERFYGAAEGMSASEREVLRLAGHGQASVSADIAGFHTSALMLGMRPMGALGWRTAPISKEMATAVSAQVAIVLARSMAMEASARLEAVRESERLRTALIDSLTHELRTPLTAIRAAATTLLQAEGLDEAARVDLTSVVDEEASRLDLLIGDAVQMAEIDANVVQVHGTPQHARALLEDALEASHRVLAAHRVSVEVTDDETPASFDPHLLARVLHHLLENAARYTPPGSRIVLRSWREGKRLEFSVEDSGPGIDPADLPLIFEKFYRGKRGPHRGKGSGMGLAIARAILIAHGGGIEAASPPGRGATFRFWVPLAEQNG
jgi:two-component system sensor histidine kinase KdpD